MSAGGPLGDWFAARSAPRLLILVLLGALLVVAGAALALTGSGSLGPRVLILGGIVLLFGASGYVAIAVFSRGFD